MSTPMSAETIAIIKSTAPTLQVHGLAITKRMYERLFLDAKIKALFDQAAQDSGEQPKRLASAILAFAQNADRLDVLAPAIATIAARHVATDVHAAHYPVVGAALLAAIKDVLGDAANDPVMAAWGEAYGFLSNVLISQEDGLYAAKA
ncbi:MAG: hypothetical protein RJA87_836 [Pseudomonadota bacterium]